MKRMFSASLCSRVLMSALMAASVSSSLIACDKVEKLDNMHDAMMDMRTQTKQLGEGTDRLEGNMGEMYDALKQGDSLSARRSSLKAMIEAEDTTRKISEAGKYFMSFEYQLWSGVGQDVPERRLEVAASACREFMRDIHEFIDLNQTDANPFARNWHMGHDNRASSLNSLAVAMHILNHKQEDMLHKHPEMKEISMYGMLQEALAANVEIEAGKKRLEDFPVYVDEILKYKNVAILLMQVRYNYLGAMALARISNVRDGAAGYVGVRLQSWDLDLKKFSHSEIREFSKYLKGALKTRDFMVSVGIQPKLDKALRASYSNMKLEEGTAVTIESIRAKSASVDGNASKEGAMVEFAGLFERYMKSEARSDEAKGSQEGKPQAAQPEDKIPEEKKSEPQASSASMTEDERLALSEELGLPL